MQTLALVIFLVAYVMVILQRERTLWIVYGASVLLMLTGVMTPGQVWASLDFNVLGILLGTMLLSNLFVFSGAPDRLAGRFVLRAGSARAAFLALCGLAGFISTFTENVATVLIVAPFALELCRRLRTDPTMLLIGISIASNLQGAATMIGDAPSMILASETGMSFNDFIWLQGRPSLFFAVQVGMLGAFAVLAWSFRGFSKSLPPVREEAAVKSWVPSWLMAGLVVTLVAGSLLKHAVPYLPAVVCLGWGAAGLAWHRLRYRESVSIVKGLDWFSLFALAGVFILVGGLRTAGLIDRFADLLAAGAGGSVLVAFIGLTGLSVLLSAFMDNVPYIIAMIPVALKVAASLGVPPQPLLFGLFIGTCLGGNITPVGSAANVVTMGLLRRNRLPGRPGDFVKLGLPFTLAAVLLGAGFIWIVWR